MKVIRAILTVLLSIVLIVGVFATGILVSVRNTYTEEKILEAMDSIDWVGLELPTSEGTMTIRDTVNEILESQNCEPLSKKDFNRMAEAFAPGKIVGEYILDVRAWLFDDGSTPYPNARKIAKAIWKGIKEVGLDDQIAGDDPEETVLEYTKETLDSMLESGDYEEAFDNIAPYRQIVSKSTAIILMAVVALLIVLMLLVNLPRLTGGFVGSGIGLMLGSGLLLAISPVVSLLLSKLTDASGIDFDVFRIAYDPLLTQFNRTGWILLACGVVLIVIAIIIASVRKAKKKTAESKRSYAVPKEETFSYGSYGAGNVASGGRLIVNNYETDRAVPGESSKAEDGNTDAEQN